jgi:hypothetical protein
MRRVQPIARRHGGTEGLAIASSESWKASIMFGIEDPGKTALYDVRHLSAWYDENGLKPAKSEPCMLHG